jgi:hypothetical protein
MPVLFSSLRFFKGCVCLFVGLWGWNFINPIHKRTEGRTPVWGSEFIKEISPEGDLAEIAAG